MKRVKKVINSIALLMFFSMGVFSVATAEENPFSSYSSKEEAIQASESEAGAEDGISADDSGNENINIYEEEDLNPIPTLENATEQRDEEEIAIIGKTDNEANNISKENAGQISAPKNNPFSSMIIIFLGVPIAVLLIFVIKKYMETYKKNN